MSAEPPVLTPAMQLQQMQQQAPGEDIDVAVLQYAQWLSEIKQRATASQHQQSGEIGALKEGLTTHSVQLADFKRHCTSVQQQLLTQVTELREKLSDCFAEIATLARQKAEVDMRAQQELQTFREVLTSKTRELEAVRRQHAEHVSTLQAQLSQCAAKLTAAENELALLRRSTGQQHDTALAKFNEVDRGMEVLHSSLAQNRKQLEEVKSTAKEERDWVHQALGNLQQEVTDYKKESVAHNAKTSAQVYVLEEATRVGAEKRSKMEGQLEGLNKVALETANEVTLLKIHEGGDYASSRPLDSESSYTGTQSDVTRRTSEMTSSQLGHTQPRLSAYPPGGPRASVGR